MTDLSPPQPAAPPIGAPVLKNDARIRPQTVFVDFIGSSYEFYKYRRHNFI